MDGLTHSLVGLTSAKAGLERLSPYTTTVCVLSANAPDIDFVSVFFGGRWVLLHHHRGITHSIIGTLALGILIPSILFGIEWAMARWRKRPPRIQYRGLVLASLIAAATHPLMDWTNNYGVRPLLPWDGRWFYGDLVFIVDPYLLLVLGGAAFLLTSNRRWKIVAWSLLALGVGLVVLRVSPQVASHRNGWVDRSANYLDCGCAVAGNSAICRSAKARGQGTGGCGPFVCGPLLGRPCLGASQGLPERGDRVAGPRRATRRELHSRRGYADGRQSISVAVRRRRLTGRSTDFSSAPQVIRPKTTAQENGSLAMTALERYEKPTGPSAQLVGVASRDPRAQILLGFARFPIARVESDNCIGQTLVQFADLRYTEPGASRGNFSLSVPVECPAR